MNKPKILLADTRYDTVGAHSNYVPIGIGYIGAYLKEKLKDYDIDLKLSTKPEEVFDLIDSWKPDVIGLSNYIWNSNLSNSICEYAKEKDNMKKYLIVGLGNIGEKYENTRHNIGFKILNHYATSNNFTFKTDKLGDIAYHKIKGRTLVFLKPSTYMNLSGKAIKYWMNK